MKVTEINELEDGGAELTVEMSAEEHDEIFEFGFNETLRGGLEIIKETEDVASNAGSDLSGYDLEELLNMVVGEFYLSFAWGRYEWVLENREGKTFYSPDPKEVFVDAIHWEERAKIAGIYM